MAENSAIAWTHHTFNPWIGCTKISEACDFCYAEEFNKRFDGGKNWGPKAPRRRTKSWSGPRKWNRIAEAKGIRQRVFCASLADVFDNHPSIEQVWRDDLWQLIRETPHLDWLLLTKRPQNMLKYLPGDWSPTNYYKNVWLGCTVENQKEADRRIIYLLKTPAAVHFVSMEPLLGPVNLKRIDLGTAKADGGQLKGYDVTFTMNALSGAPKTGIPKLDWVITGGESGENFRPADPDWFRSLRDQCAEYGTAFLFKQWEGATQKIIKAKGRELDGVIHDVYPN